MSDAGIHREAEEMELYTHAARAGLARLRLGAKRRVHPKPVAGVREGFAPAAAAPVGVERVVTVGGKRGDRSIALPAQAMLAGA